MSDACAIAVGAVSPLGLGDEAYRVARPGEPARTALRRDPELAAADLARPSAGRAPAELGVARSGDRATDLLLAALSQATAILDEVRPGWRGERLGIAIGTSSGGMLTAERFFAARAAGRADEARELAAGATYFAPLEAALAAVGLAGVPRRTQILAACAASTIALGVATRWLDRRACDSVLAGGYDGLSVFVASGFEALRATTATTVRPFRLGRDGMSLGEGAGVVALVRDEDVRGARVSLRVAGFGASTDAVHITAPDRTGSGLARAALAALSDAGWSAARVGLVSAHATATPYNDAMESKALARVFDGAPPPVIHPFKAQIGHTLGAAGVLEALAAADALASGVAPAAAGEGELDPEAPALLLATGERRALHGALKVSAAFGGANAALALAREPSGREPAPVRPVYLHAHATVEDADLAALAEATGVARDRLARLDVLCRLGLAAVTALAAEVGKDALRGAGIVAGHALATLDTNEQFDVRKRERGARFVEPRLFPATSPNAIAGESAIVHGLTGPSFAVGAGLDGGMEALARAAELVASGDADRVVVVAADDAGPATQALLRSIGRPPVVRGAVALLLCAEQAGARCRVPLDVQGGARAAGEPIGHMSLRAWIARETGAGGPKLTRP